MILFSLVQLYLKQHFWMRDMRFDVEVLSHMTIKRATGIVLGPQELANAGMGSERKLLLRVVVQGGSGSEMVGCGLRG